MLPGCLKFVYVCYFFNAKRRVSEMLACLIWFIRFQMTLAWTKNERKVKRSYFKFINVALCLSELNHNHLCRNETKKGKIWVYEYFSLKNSPHRILFSNKTHRVCKFLPFYAKQKIFFISAFSRTTYSQPFEWNRVNVRTFQIRQG